MPDEYIEMVELGGTAMVLPAVLLLLAFLGLIAAN